MIVSMSAIRRALSRFVGRLFLLVLAVEIILHGYFWWAGEQNILQPEPVWGWRVKPNLGRAFRSSNGFYVMETNSHGHRDLEHAVTKRHAKFRLLMLGSSTVFGDGVDQPEIFAELLEKSLYSTEVINLSVPSVSIDQQYLMLREEGLKYKPDIVIQFVVFTDALDPFFSWQLGLHRSKCWLGYTNDQFVIHPPERGLLERALQSSYLCQFSMAMALLSLPTVDIGADDYQLMTFAGQPLSRPERGKALRSLLLATRELCQQSSARHLLVFLPSKEILAGQALSQFDFLQQEVFSQLTASGDFDLADLTEPFKKAQDQGVILFDKFHLNANGHRIISEILARKVQSQEIGVENSPRDEAHAYSFGPRDG